MPAPRVARQSEPPGAGWFATPLARRLLRLEQQESIPVLTGCFGRHGLYLRCHPSAPEELSGNLLQAVLRLHQREGQLAGDLRCDADALPLQRESVDLVYLLHALETSDDMRGLLSEVERVLAPDGTLLLLALNPYSLWRMRWIGRGPRPASFGGCRARLREAGFDVVRHRGVGPVLPWLREDGGMTTASGASRDPWAVWRAGFLVQARKHRPALTPVRPRAGAVALQPGMRAG